MWAAGLAWLIVPPALKRQLPPALSLSLPGRNGHNLLGPDGHPLPASCNAPLRAEGSRTPLGTGVLGQATARSGAWPGCAPGERVWPRARAAAAQLPRAAAERPPPPQPGARQMCWAASHRFSACGLGMMGVVVQHVWRAPSWEGLAPRRRKASVGARHGHAAPEGRGGRARGGGGGRESGARCLRGPNGGRQLPQRRPPAGLKVAAPRGPGRAGPWEEPPAGRPSGAGRLPVSSLGRVAMATSQAAAAAAMALAMADEESERDSVHTGESHDLGEELQQDLAQLSLAQLLAVVEESSHANSMLKLETDMFEKCFNRMETRDMTPEKHGSSLDLGQVQYTRGRRKSKSRITTDRLLCLTVEQKCDLAQRELEETKEDIQQMKENSERNLQNYLAVLEEADIRTADIKRAVLDFDKDIVKTITKKKGSVIASEKVLRYMEDKIRTRDVQKEKIRLKNDSLKVQKKKMQLQLKQKEELGEALHEVDFQQLKIENAQFLEKIDERNQDLLQLKLTVGNALQILNFYKKKLQNTTAMATLLVKDIAQRKDSLEKIAREAILVEEERDTAEVLNKKLRRQLAEYKVPPVLNYVHEKMAIHELENTIKIWERKVEIAQMALQSYHSVWHKAKMASQQLQTLLP